MESGRPRGLWWYGLFARAPYDLMVGAGFGGVRSPDQEYSLEAAPAAAAAGTGPPGERR